MPTANKELKEFAERVKLMRTYQELYFDKKTRSRTNLIMAKQEERRIDREIDALLFVPKPDLFSDKPGGV